MKLEPKSNQSCLKTMDNLEETSVYHSFINDKTKKTRSPVCTGSPFCQNRCRNGNLAPQQSIC